MKDPKQLIQSQKSFFETGKTRDISFIKGKLKRLKESIITNDELPKGKTQLRTWLFDSKGNAGGAYFTDVELIKER